MRPEDLYLDDISRAAVAVERFIRDRRRADLDHDELLLSGVLYKLTVIGEAAAHLGPEIRAEIPEIPWRSVVGFRNLVIHEYFGLDLDIVWTTVTVQVPVLRQAVTGFMASRAE